MCIRDSCIPVEFGGMGFSMFEYAMVGAEIAKYCGATALTFNMHNSSMAWSRFTFEMGNLTDADRAAFAPPVSYTHLDVYKRQAEIMRAKYDFDVTGHYARPDVFSLTVDTTPKLAVKTI